MKEVRVRRRDPVQEKRAVVAPQGYALPNRGGPVARTIRPPAASTPWRMALATAHRGEFESLTPAVNLPRRRTELEALGATLMLALLFHTVAIFAFIVANPETNKSDYQFFSDVQLVEVATVDMVEMVKPPEPPKPAPPPPQAKPAIPPPMPAAQPGVKPAAAPGPAPAPKPFAPRPQPVVKNPGPRVVASQNSQGPPVHVGQGGGDPNGVPGGQGQGPPDSNGQGAGGGGGDPQPTGPPLQATTSAIEWNNYEKLGIGMPDDPMVRTRAAECQTWEEIAGVLGLDKAKLFSQPLVEPYCRGQRNPSLDEQYQIAGKTGSVAIKCRIDSSGRPTPQLLGTTGDPTMDQIAMKIAMDSMWLPAMQYGRIVDYEIQFELKFSSVQ